MEEMGMSWGIELVKGVEGGIGRESYKKTLKFEEKTWRSAAQAPQSCEL